MALVNPNIAMSFRGLQLPPPTNALAQYAQLMQIQSAQQQQQMGALQMEEAQRRLDRLRQDDAAVERIRQAAMQHGGPSDPVAIEDAMISSGNPDFTKQGLAMRQHRQDKAEFQRLYGRMFPGMFPEAPAAAPTPEPSGAVVGGAMTPPPARVTPTPLGPPGGPAPVNALAPAGTIETMPLNQLRATQMALGSSTDPRAKTLSTIIEKEIESRKQPESVRAYEYAKTPAGGGFKGTFEEWKRAGTAQLLTPEVFAQQVELAQARRAPPAPKAPVAVVGPDGKPVLVSPEEAIGKTPAAAMEGLTPKEKQKREAAYPKSTSALKTTEQDIDQMVKDIQTLLTDPGLNSITGLVYGRTPSVTREGRRAQALYDKIIAKGGFQMLSNMRAASPTGGALGNVSDREGIQLRAAFAALDRTQDAADVKQVLTDLITQLGATKTNLREAYDLTYEYRTGGGGAPTSGGWSIVK
jgi:hypothetical protein